MSSPIELVAHNVELHGKGGSARHCVERLAGRSGHGASRNAEHGFSLGVASVVEGGENFAASRGTEAVTEYGERAVDVPGTIFVAACYVHVCSNFLGDGVEPGGGGGAVEFDGVVVAAQGGEEYIPTPAVTSCILASNSSSTALQRFLLSLRRSSAALTTMSFMKTISNASTSTTSTYSGIYCAERCARFFMETTLMFVRCVVGWMSDVACCVVGWLTECATT